MVEGVTVSTLTITEYDQLVSFCLEADDGKEVFIQYARDQLWIDESGIWQVKEGEDPAYIGPVTPKRKPNVKISHTIEQALAEVLECGGRSVS